MAPRFPMPVWMCGRPMQKGFMIYNCQMSKEQRCVVCFIQMKTEVILSARFGLHLTLSRTMARLDSCSEQWDVTHIDRRIFTLSFPRKDSSQLQPSFSS